jgi:hypothetical protein
MATGKYNNTKHDVPEKNFVCPPKDDAYKKATPEEQKKLDEDCRKEMEKIELAFTKAIRKAMKG